MSATVLPLRKYVNEAGIDHVMHDRQGIQQIYSCPTCGDLQVISGVCVHTRPIEDHDQETLVPVADPDGDECHNCGRIYSAVFNVPNELWSRIAPSPETLGPHIEHQGGGMLCPDCAADAAKALGVRLVFVGKEWGG